MPSKEKWAILIGVDSYQDSTFNSLRFCVYDMNALYEILVQPERGGYDKENTLLISDQGGKDFLPTRSNIMHHVSSLARMAKEDDIILFAFSGHGMEEGGSSYLLPADARTGILTQTGIAVKWIKETLGQATCRAKVMVLDACHAGAMTGRANTGQMTQGFAKEITDLAEGFALLSSCKLNEVSYEWEEKKHGVFSHFLCEGLMGYADLDSDGKITVSEANRYVTERVTKWAFNSNRQQSPTLELKVSGDIILAYVPGTFKPVSQDNKANIGSSFANSMTLLHIESFRVSVPYSEYDTPPEWQETETEAYDAAKRKAKSMCAELLRFYKHTQIKFEDQKGEGKYSFPDGSISISTYSDPDDQQVQSYVELTIQYDPARQAEIDTLIEALSSELSWYCLTYKCPKKFDLGNLIELCQKSGMTILSFDPTGESPIRVSAPGWGAAGEPATVYFSNSEKESVIKILQKQYSSYEIAEDFYEKLNPKTLVEFLKSAFEQ
ncbi:MAG: caspase domain-containing protein [Candidatus Bathyarchaeia archaeon]